ncbi:hypothetical protein [Acaricomes phytoseiuli]|uniref:hypothetical protein n=1 Tax=Acaricomes phytoseiuli TaxID=291968 RepID=UPI0003660F1A|nr:hypothetical protein [Acaricomes phytoseiuli]
MGHKEACSALPEDAVLLASSAQCPVQMFRIGANVYATQFHPELDIEGLLLRIEAYRHHGYFPAEEYAAVREALQEQGGKVREPGRILHNFVELYRQ